MSRGCFVADLRIERVVVTGGRGFTDYGRILADLRALRRVGLRRVAEGASNGGGADWLAHDAWREITGESTERYRVRSEVDGRHRGAPAARNIRMLEAESRLAGEAGESLVVLAYPDPRSRGTWHCVREALRRGIPVAVWMRGIPDAPLLGLTAAYRHYGDRVVIGPPASFTASGVAARVMEVLRG